MSFAELFIIALGLSADAFAVSVGKGLGRSRPSLSSALKCGAWFGAAQALMPLIGYLLGSVIGGAVSQIDHWVAFALLMIIGVKAIIEGARGKDGDDASLSPLPMLTAAIATSIDALAVGVTLSFFAGSIYLSVAVIGAVTFALSFIGALLGGVLGKLWQRGSKIFGGAVLCAIGIKILIEHLVQGK